MDIINIFTILLLTKVKQNNKIIMLSNYCKNIDTKYLWKLLLIRDNRINNLIRSYYNSYILYTNEIGHCINLQYFYINNNQLQNIPSEIGHCINLRTLYIDNNQAKIISHKIKKQKYVKIY